MFLLALGITLYPLISNWYNERHQSEIHTQYEEILDKIDDTELLEARAAAADYNATLVPGTQSGDSFSQEAIREAAENYDSLLNMSGDGIMGYVEIPICCCGSGFQEQPDQKLSAKEIQQCQRNADEPDHF